MTGTTPATAASKRSCTPCSRATRPQLLAVLAEQLLVGGHDVLAGAHRPQHVVARGLDPADQLDDEVAAGEDLVEVAARARQDAADLRAQAGDRGDVVGALAEQRLERAADRAVAEQADAEALGAPPAQSTSRAKRSS